MVICQNIATFAFIILQTSLKIMSLIEIKKVETKKDLKTFIDFHYDLYEGNEYDVPNLFSDDMNTLSKDKNAAFEFCEAEYYLAYKDGKLAGRVAAIINHKANNKWGRKSVRFGWIDFIDDREVSKALLDAVEKYGKEKGMEDIVGPLGFTDMDPEGMLTWGYNDITCPPTTSYAVWNTLKCEKEALLTPINEHWTTSETNYQQMVWIKEHLIK